MVVAAAAQWLAKSPDDGPGAGVVQADGADQDPVQCGVAVRRGQGVEHPDSVVAEVAGDSCPTGASSGCIISSGT